MELGLSARRAKYSHGPQHNLVAPTESQGTRSQKVQCLLARQSRSFRNAQNLLPTLAVLSPSVNLLSESACSSAKSLIYGDAGQVLRTYTSF